MGIRVSLQNLALDRLNNNNDVIFQLEGILKQIGVTRGRLERSKFFFQSLSFFLFVHTLPVTLSLFF